jgi:hypothetical protein
MIYYIAFNMSHCFDVLHCRIALICYIVTFLWYATLLLFCCTALMCYIVTLHWYATLPLTLHWYATLSHCFDVLHCQSRWSFLLLLCHCSMCKAFSDDKRNNTTLYFSWSMFLTESRTTNWGLSGRRSLGRRSKKALSKLTQTLAHTNAYLFHAFRGWNICSMILLDTCHHLCQGP